MFSPKKWRLAPKRWRLALMTALTAIALFSGLATPAFASQSGQPGECNCWNIETVGNQDLSAGSSMSEAWNGGYKIQVWRGFDNNIVWISVNGGEPFNLANADGTTTATYVNPVVIPYGLASFMIFHTGSDNNIYYTTYDPSNGAWSHNWYHVPYQTTYQAVSAAQLGSGGTEVYLVYRSSIDNTVWGTRYNGTYWLPAASISQGTSNAAPSVTYNDSRLWVAMAGLDDNLYMVSSSNLGTTWATGWFWLGGNTRYQPTIATANSFDMLVSYVDANNVPYYRAVDWYGHALTDWSQDLSVWQTYSPVNLVARGNTIFAIITGKDGYVYSKQAFSTP